VAAGVVGLSKLKLMVQVVAELEDLDQELVLLLGLILTIP